MAMPPWTLDRNEARPRRSQNSLRLIDFDRRRDLRDADLTAAAYDRGDVFPLDAFVTPDHDALILSCAPSLRRDEPT